MGEEHSTGLSLWPSRPLGPGRVPEGAAKDRSVRRGTGGLSRRDFLRDGAAVMAGGLLASVGSTALADGVAAAASRGRPRSGGMLRVGTLNEVNSFNPFSGNLNSPGILYARTVFDPLTAVAEDGSIRPFLAQAVTPNADYSSWTITLRPGVFFHDGSRLDSTALKYYFDAMLGSVDVKLSLALLKGATITGPLSVRVDMTEPWVPFPAYLCGQLGTSQIGFVPAPSMLRNPNGGLHPVGTGPFVFSQWLVNDHFLAKRNPHYWRRGLPYLDQIEYRPIVEDSARAASLLSGTIDAMQTTSPVVIDQLRSNGSIRIVTNEHHSVGEPQQNFVMLNTAVPPLDDPGVRKALAQAIDVRRLVSLTTRGLEVPSTGPFAPGTPYYVPTGYPTYDLRSAKRLIADYRARKGPVKIVFSTGQSQFGLSQVELVQSMWSAAGVEVTLAPAVSASTNISQTLVGKYQAQIWQQFGVPDPDLNYIFWTSKLVTPVGQFSTNFARNKDPLIDKALEIGRTDPNPVARMRAYRTIGPRFAVDLPYLWLSRVSWALAFRDTVQGVTSPRLPSGVGADWLNQGDVWFTQVWLS